mmetsp:Transcript_21708/g.61757  ORF Transcript_21708/g.61757 Transcript_21708/m.61757 type:complete len:127 (-) Transcript_21708:698-1078(-)
MRQTTLLDEEDSPAMYHDLLGLSEWRHGKFDLCEIKCLMRQLLEGLQHCHQHHIIHRDIKSSNLLLTKEGELKLGDFGLARLRVKSSQQGHSTNRKHTVVQTAGAAAWFGQVRHRCRHLVRWVHIG